MSDLKPFDRFEFEMIESSPERRVLLMYDTQYDDKYTLEVIKVTDISVAYLRNIEFMISLQLMNPFLLLYHEILSNNCSGLVLMEYYEKDIEVWMHDRGGLLEEQEVIDFSAQIIEGLSFLNDKGIIHRNIEPRNIYLNQNHEVKLNNYGVETENSCGFVAAEVIERGEYSLSSDVFSTGCVMYYMTTQRAPFVGTTPISTITKVLKGEFPPIMEEKYSDELKSLIYSMLDKDPRKRPSVQTLKNNTLIRRALDALPARTDVPKLPDISDYPPCHYAGANVTPTGTPSLTKEALTGDASAPSLLGQGAESRCGKAILP